LTSKQKFDYFFCNRFMQAISYFSAPRTQRNVRTVAPLFSGKGAQATSARNPASRIRQTGLTQVIEEKNMQVYGGLKKFA
jgi:hypothetical protein